MKAGKLVGAPSIICLLLLICLLYTFFSSDYTERSKAQKAAHSFYIGKPSEASKHRKLDPKDIESNQAEPTQAAVFQQRLSALLCDLKSNDPTVLQGAIAKFVSACSGHPDDINTEYNSDEWVIDSAIASWHSAYAAAGGRHISDAISIKGILDVMIPLLNSSENAANARKVVDNVTFMIYEDESDEWWLGDGYAESAFQSLLKRSIPNLQHDFDYSRFYSK